jgi:hypothetical protein
MGRGIFADSTIPRKSLLPQPLEMREVPSTGDRGEVRRLVVSISRPTGNRSGHLEGILSSTTVQKKSLGPREPLPQFRGKWRRASRPLRMAGLLCCSRAVFWAPWRWRVLRQDPHQGRQSPCLTEALNAFRLHGHGGDCDGARDAPIIRRALARPIELEKKTESAQRGRPDRG